MSDDLITWLRAQLDEDERVAKAATGGGWYAADMSIRGKTHLNGNDVLVVRHTWPHIIRHDPVRVLAEVEAKRAILATEDGRRMASGPSFEVRVVDGRYLIGQPEDGYGLDLSPEEFRDRYTVPAEPSRTVRLLALPYADREGYREEWRP